MKTKKLVIFGAGGFAEVAYEYFQCDSVYQVVGFTVNQDYLGDEGRELLGLPVLPFETLKDFFQLGEIEIFVAITYTKLNRLRESISRACIDAGFKLASFVSTKAAVSSSVTMGGHNFILENNVLQPFVQVGEGVILWSGNHVGHHSTIEDYVFISSHVVISGNSRIGKYSFLGVNSAVGDGVVVGESSWLSPGVVLTKSTERDLIWRSTEPTPAKVSATKYFKVRKEG